MTSLHYITSTNPANYGKVSYSATPTVSQPCQIRVSSIQYDAHFSITTKEDFVKLHVPVDTQPSGAVTKEYTTVYFPECGYYLKDLLPTLLSAVLNKSDSSTSTIEIKLNDRGLLEYKGANVEICDASHRAKLLMGLYHLPDEAFPIDISNGYTAPSTPLTSFGNILYLESNLPSPVGVRGTDKNKEEYKSIVYKGSDYLYPGIPVNSRTPGPVIATKTEALTDLEFTLVDFQMYPVILHSPLTITLEVFYGIKAIPMTQVA